MLMSRTLRVPIAAAAVVVGLLLSSPAFAQGGKRVAREVHVFDDSLRGLAEGHYPWDLESEPNMMTNANIAKVEEVGTDRVLRLNYSGGEQTITIPTSATGVAFDKAPADQLAAGRKVFVPRRPRTGRMAASLMRSDWETFGDLRNLLERAG